MMMVPSNNRMKIEEQLEGAPQDGKKKKKKNKGDKDKDGKKKCIIF